MQNFNFVLFVVVVHGKCNAGSIDTAIVNSGRHVIVLLFCVHYSFTIGDSDNSGSSGEEEIYQKSSDKKEVATL